MDIESDSDTWENFFGKCCKFVEPATEPISAIDDNAMRDDSACATATAGLAGVTRAIKAEANVIAARCHR